MTLVTLLSDVMSNVMTFTELKFSLETWCKDEFDAGRNDVRRCYYRIPKLKLFPIFVI